MKTIEFDIDASLGEKSKIGILTIHRPEALNALNKTVITELKMQVAELESKRDVRALIITGSGEKAFVAGADIREMEDLTPVQARELSLQGQQLFQKIEDLPMPVLGAVNGFALGGGLELALACDFLIASQKAKWGLPEVGLGLIPGYGGTQRLSRVVGKSLAKRVALSGEIFTAEQGLRWGLFADVVSPEELMPTAKKIAETLTGRAPLAMAWTKDAINNGFERSLAEGLKLENDHFAKTFETKDHQEGLRAFIEKRPPRFQGN